jgi:hypothetical protein
MKIMLFIPLNQPRFPLLSIHISKQKSAIGLGGVRKRFIYKISFYAKNRCETT